MACRQATVSDKFALWYPEPIATDGGNAGDIPHTQDARGGVEREAEPWGVGWYPTTTAAIEHKRC